MNVTGERPPAGRSPFLALTSMATTGSTTTGYSYQFGQAGNRTNATELNGRSINRSYDGIYRLTNESISGDPSNVNGSVAYGLDPGATGSRRPRPRQDS